jgi:hypothetical protein
VKRVRRAGGFVRAGQIVAVRCGDLERELLPDREIERENLELLLQDKLPRAAGTGGEGKLPRFSTPLELEFELRIGDAIIVGDAVDVRGILRMPAPSRKLRLRRGMRSEAAWSARPQAAA